MKQNGTRLEKILTPSVNNARITISCKTKKKIFFFVFMNILLSSENNQSVYSIADFFVRFTTLSE